MLSDLSVANFTHTSEHAATSVYSSKGAGGIFGCTWVSFYLTVDLLAILCLFFLVPLSRAVFHVRDAVATDLYAEEVVALAQLHYKE